MRDWENDVGPGWRPIVRAAAHLLTQRGAVVTQVKEKFGGLRVYFHPGRSDGESQETLSAIADAAERLAWGLCEECGEAGSLRSDLSWLKTLCDQHYKERKNR